MTVIRGYTTETCSLGTYPNQKVRAGLSREKEIQFTSLLMLLTSKFNDYDLVFIVYSKKMQEAYRWAGILGNNSYYTKCISHGS